MPLAELKYIDTALLTLDKKRDHFEVISKQLKVEFNEIMKRYSKDFLNITTRVKGHDSLKEKILRQGYYKKFDDPKHLIYQLSDLIGVRIECRFEQDEREIFKVLKNTLMSEIKKEGIITIPILILSFISMSVNLNVRKMDLKFSVLMGSLKILTMIYRLNFKLSHWLIYFGVR